MLRFWCTCCLIFVLLASARQACAGKVLVIESYHQGFSWDASYLRGLREVLASDHEIRTFEMDTKRIPAEQFSRRAAEALAVFREYKPDLVVLGDDNAARLLAPALLAAAVPIVFLGLNNNPREYSLYGHPHVAGLMERPLLFQSVSVARKICPFPIRRVLFLFDVSETSNLIAGDVFHDGASKELLGIRADLRQVATVEEWKDAVQTAGENGYDLIFVGLSQRLEGAESGCCNDEDMVLWTAQHSPVPSFGLWDFSIGRGKLAAGLVHVGEEQGRAAGNLARRLLAGERSVSIPLAVEDGVLMYSRFEAARLGLVFPAGLALNAVAVE